MIKSLGLALATLIAFAAAPMAAHAADPAPKIDVAIDADHHKQGQKEAPAVVARSNLTCPISDAYFIGVSNPKGDDGKPVETKLYEVACTGGLGYILLAPAAGPAKHYDCITITSSPTLRCRLPANADAKAAISPWVQASGQTCAVSDVHGIGSTPAGDTFFEVACRDRLGFILKHDAAGASTATDCALAVGTNVECKMTTVEQIKAADRKTIETLTAASGKTCQIKDTRTIGKLTSGGSAYEVACTAGDGYVLMTKPDGAFQTAVACGNADAIAGGCKLTDAVAAQTSEAGTYSRLAKASSFPCEVSKYHFIGMDKNNNEVVELACSNRPDGGIAVFPANNSPGHVFDCVQAGSLGQQCHLSDPALVYNRYTAALAAKGRNSCKVSGAHWVGHSAEHNSDLIETACADGLPGYVVEVSTAGQAMDVLSCGQAKASGIQCTLPTNRK